MSFNSYKVGALVTIESAFTAESDGSNLDPDTVLLSVRSPDGVVRTYTYGSNNIVVKQPDGTTTTITGGASFITRIQTGEYSANLNANAPGTWYYFWHSTGNGQAADEKFFRVNSPHAA